MGKLALAIAFFAAFVWVLKGAADKPSVEEIGGEDAGLVLAPDEGLVFAEDPGQSDRVIALKWWGTSAELAMLTGLLASGGVRTGASNHGDTGARYEAPGPSRLYVHEEDLPLVRELMESIDQGVGRLEVPDSDD